MPRYAATPTGYTPSLAARLAEMFSSASDAVGTFSNYMSKQDELEQTRQEQLLKRFLGLATLQEKLKPKVPEPFTLGEGQQRFGPDGQPIAAVPKSVKPPEDFSLSEGQNRYSAAGGSPIASNPRLVKPPEDYTLSPGQQRFSASNESVANVPREPKEPPAPSAERDYHAIAQEQLGPGASPAQIAGRARQLATKAAVDVSAAQGREAQLAQFRPLTPGASPEYAPRPGEPPVAYKKRIEAQAEIGIPKPPGVEERQARVYMETVGELGKKAERLLANPNIEQYMGYKAGIVSGATQLDVRNRLNQVPDELAELDQVLQALQNRLNRAMNGARASDQDIVRVMRESPNLSDAPSRARVKLKATLQNIAIWERRAAEAEGRAQPAPQSSTLPPGLHP